MEEVKGFLRAEGKRLVNGDGKEMLLRGVGLGNWILPEGYMWKFPDEGDRPRRIEGMIEELLGKEISQSFWEKYYDTYIAEEDLSRIKEEGFNSIRVPINSRFLYEKSDIPCYNEAHLKLLDRLMDWCEKYRLYVILDLHGAPGGQTGTNIDDSEIDRPQLFEQAYNRWLTIDIWRMLAERYKDRWIVAGYDLLNEPLPEWFSEFNEEVMPLYKEIVKVIREVDQRHMIILEGVHWSTDWSIFHDKFDDNMMLEFHKYWNNPDIESIKPYLDKREELDLPVFMGEGGENNKDWYVGAFKLYENMNISWNFWTWKKMSTTNSPCSIIMPKDWTILIEFLKGENKPDKLIAKRVLFEYLSNIKFNQCEYFPEVIDSVFSRVPVRIPAIFYDFHGEGTSYYANQIKVKKIGFRDNDMINIGFVEGSELRPNFYHSMGEDLKDNERLYIQLNAGDWVSYEMNIREFSESINFFIELNTCILNNYSKVSISIDGEVIGNTIIKNKVWNISRIEGESSIKPGMRRIIITASENPVCIEWLRLSLKSFT